MVFSNIKEFVSGIYLPPFLKELNIKETLEKSKNVVRAVYYFIAFFAVTTVIRLEGMRHLESFNATWPIEWWASGLNYHTVITVTQIIFLFGSFFAALFYKKVWARILVFFACTQVFAFTSSFEQVDHTWYHMFYVLFFLMFLPNVWKKETKRRSISFLTFLWGSQAFLLLSYSMSGLEKVLKGIEQFFIGNVSLFSPESVSLLVTYWTARREELGLLSEWFISNPVFGWLGFLFFVYIMLFSIVAAFRPRLHPVWAVFLIIFHLSTYFIFKIIFIPSIGIILFLLLQSPFSIDKSFNLKKTLKDFPLFGDIWRLCIFLNKKYMNI